MLKREGGGPDERAPVLKVFIFILLFFLRIKRKLTHGG